MYNTGMEDKLVEIGNWLYGIDSCEELNGAGFNKVDKEIWPNVVGRTSSMQRCLAKYKRQISERYGLEVYESLGFNNINDTVTSNASIVNGLLSFTVVGKIKDFQVFLNYHRQNKFKGTKVRGDFYWCVTGSTIYNESDYRDFLNSLGITLNEVTVSPPETGKVNGKHKVHINVIDRKIAVSYEFSRALNELLSNKNNFISGILEYNPSDHSRCTYDLELVEEIIEKIDANKFEVIESVAFQEFKQWYKTNKENNYREIPIVKNVLNDGFNLLPYQNEGVNALIRTNGNFLNNDEMGLGKTIQALAYIAATNKTALVVVPKTVRRNWINEAIKFFKCFNKDNTFELTSKNFSKINNEHKLVSTNYETFKKIHGSIEANRFDVLVIDESHRVKNPKAQITQACLLAASKFSSRILLSGTSVKNKREEIQCQVDIVQKDFFDKRVSNMTIGEVWNKMRDISICRTKKKVLPDLPEKFSQIIELEVKNMPEMVNISFEDIARFKAESAIAKVDATVDFVKEILESSESCVLVFSDSKEAIEKIASKLGKNAILHHGQMSDDKREKAKEDFQNNPNGPRVFCTTRQSMAVGATLTRADKVVLNDLPWNHADIAQAEDRCHRIGQLSCVNCYWVSAANSAWDRKLSLNARQRYDLHKKVNQGIKLTEEEKQLLENPTTLAEIFN